MDPGLPLALLGPLGCGIQTGAGSVLVALGVSAGSSIAIFGTGSVGLAAVMAASVAGAATIIAVDLQPSRLDLAARLGATHTINGSDDDICAQILAITGDGAQYCFDTTGVPAAISTAVGSLRQAHHQLTAQPLPRVLIEASQYPPHFDEMVQNIVRAWFGGARMIIQAAVDRRELPAGTPPDLIIDAIMGRVISLIVLSPGAQRAAIYARRDYHAASIADFVVQAVKGRPGG